MTKTAMRILFAFAFVFATLIEPTLVSAAQKFDLGVNRPNLFFLPPDQSNKVIDDMASNGVTYLRVGLVGDPSRVQQVIKYANERRINVILVLRVWSKEYYSTPPSSDERDRPYFGRPYALSQLDLGKFMASWTEHRKEMRDANAHVFAYEIGNELNGSGFNGDFLASGQEGVLTRASCPSAASCEQIRAGMKKYVAVLKAIRESESLNDALMIAGGTTAIDEPAAAKTHRMFFTAEGWTASLRQLGADAYVDGYAAHFYPNLRPQQAQNNSNLIERRLDYALAGCSGSTHASKPCWITEWGVYAASQACDGGPSWVDAIGIIATAIRRRAMRGEIEGAMYFDWDTDKNRRLFRCGRLATSAPIQP